MQHSISFFLCNRTAAPITTTTVLHLRLVTFG